MIFFVNLNILRSINFINYWKWIIWNTSIILVQYINTMCKIMNFKYMKLWYSNEIILIRCMRYKQIRINLNQYELIYEFMWINIIIIITSFSTHMNAYEFRRIKMNLREFVCIQKECGLKRIFMNFYTMYIEIHLFEFTWMYVNYMDLCGFKWICINSDEFVRIKIRVVISL